MQLSLINSAIILFAGQCIFAAPTGTVNINDTLTFNGLAPQFSPVFSNMNISSFAKKPMYNYGPVNTNSTLLNKTLDLSRYPAVWSQPNVNHPEVKAVIKQINWNLVPNYPPKTMVDYDLDQSGYDEDKDETCWWSSTNCVKPKLNYLPEDYYTCPTKGDWGLSYDDGPFNLRDEYDGDAKTENRFAEPELYNFLAKENVTSTLFVSFNGYYNSIAIVKCIHVIVYWVKCLDIP